MVIAHVLLVVLAECKACQIPDAMGLADRLVGEYPPSIILCFILAIISLAIGNLFFDRSKSARSAAKRNGNLIAHLITRCNESGEPLLEVALRNGRTYIGFITDCGFRNRAEFDFAIVPMASGYEDKVTHEVTIVKYHWNKIKKIITQKRNKGSIQGSSEDLQIVLSSSDVLTVRVFDPAEADPSYGRKRSELGSVERRSEDLRTQPADSTPEGIAGTAIGKQD